MVLYLIGIGLADEKDITLRGLEVVKSCTKVFLENYTSKLQCAIEDLEQLYGKKVVLAGRDLVENHAEIILQHAKGEDVAFLVIGDVFGATTHMDLFLRAAKEGIETRIIHNASILTAVGITGLELYKFGKTTSIPFSDDTYHPRSYYDIIAENKSIGAHTLILLDLKPEANAFMTMAQAADLLLAAEREKKKGIITEKTFAVGVAALGGKQRILPETLSSLKDSSVQGLPQAIIIPGPLHFIEEEALMQWKTL
jgi:diphthine methyl ester synthase